VTTSAKQKQGISILKEKIQDHQEYLRKSHAFEQRRRLRYEAELIEIIRKRLMEFIFDEKKLKSTVDRCINQISKKELDPYSAAEQILGKILK
jgi:LAO/AO transport system kinase